MSRRKQPPAKPTIYKRPYWFDRARSLCELHGWPGSDPGDGLGLIGRYKRAVNRPVGQLGADELVLLFTQQTDPHYLVPVALDLVRHNPDVTLLRCIVRQTPAFWASHPALGNELATLLERLPSPLAELSEDLANEAAMFEHQRVR